MTEKLVVPRRKIKKDWHVGLDPDPVDRSHPDVHDDRIILEAAEKASVSRKLKFSKCNFLCISYHCCCFMLYLSWFSLLT